MLMFTSFIVYVTLVTETATPAPPGTSIRAALAVQLLNETISASRALEWGIAYTKTVSDSLEHEIETICTRLLAKKAGSLRRTKQLMQISVVGKALEAERGLFVETVDTPQAIEGVKTFLRKGTNT